MDMPSMNLVLKRTLALLNIPSLRETMMNCKERKKIDEGIKIAFNSLHTGTQTQGIQLSKHTTDPHRKKGIQLCIQASPVR